MYVSPALKTAGRKVALEAKGIVKPAGQAVETTVAAALQATKQDFDQAARAIANHLNSRWGIKISQWTRPLTGKYRQWGDVTVRELGKAVNGERKFLAGARQYTIYSDGASYLEKVLGGKINARNGTVENLRIKPLAIWAELKDSSNAFLKDVLSGKVRP